MTTTMVPLVVDCFQGEEIKDWAEVYASGIRGVIHKCSEGANFRDKTYAVRRPRALKAGLLWGAYHFMNDTDVEAQVANFLEASQPDAHTLLALDYEENKHRTGSLEQARRFMELVYAKTGQRPVLYSGNLIKEQLHRPDPFFNSHRLWLAHYSAKPTMPAGWARPWLHQYTGDGVGPGPHEVPGIATRGIDLNVFHGEDLAAEWAPLGTIALPAPASSVTADAPIAVMPPQVKIAAKSPTIWSLLFAAAAAVGDGIRHVAKMASDLLGNIPDIVNDATASIEPTTKLLDILQLNSVKLGVAIGVACLIVAIIRHVDLHTSN